MRLIILLLILLITIPFVSCDETTEPEVIDSPVGVWSISDGDGFAYLALLADDTFLYAENDLTVQNPEENGLEVGDYSYNSSTNEITFNVIYDDNYPNNDSGISDIGNPIIISALLSTDGTTLTLGNGELVLSK